MMFLLDYFEDIEDPRVDRTKDHLLSDILGVVLCATPAGAQGWDTIQRFGLAREPWLRSFLKLANGIPSSDTMRRVISRIDSRQFPGMLHSLG